LQGTPTEAAVSAPAASRGREHSGYSLVGSLAWCEIMRDYKGSDHAPVRVRFRGIPPQLLMRETLEVPLVSVGGGGRND
jgi:hypothetical protein